MCDMADLERIITEYQAEVVTAVGSYESWKTIQNRAASDPALLARLNADVRAWLSIIHSLQLTYLIVLGRIFDSDRRTLTLPTLVRECRSHRGQFSRSALRERRLRGVKGAAPGYLDGYIAACAEPSEADFDEIETALQSHLATYKRSYKDIRDKLMAHRELALLGRTDALFARTQIGELEALLNFAYGAGEVLWHWMHNGRKTDPDDYRYETVALDTRKDVESMLKTIAATK
jgi:hypothetical protein